jgi:hypothetical protein
VLLAKINRGEWKTQNKTRKIAVPITTTTNIITITIIKKMKTGDTDNRKENAYNLFLYQRSISLPAFTSAVSTHSKQSHMSISNVLLM